mmetsp:Transcript_36881/g.83465  ORF Transcript_36881/g.83465 Transcript_36881/m.83465 type:complete len:526 (-) Transcript_36881:381-1958(-)
MSKTPRIFYWVQSTPEYGPRKGSSKSTIHIAHASAQHSSSASSFKRISAFAASLSASAAAHLAFAQASCSCCSQMIASYVLLDAPNVVFPALELVTIVKSPHLRIVNALREFFLALVLRGDLPERVRLHFCLQKGIGSCIQFALRCSREHVSLLHSCARTFERRMMLASDARVSVDLIFILGRRLDHLDLSLLWPPHANHVLPLPEAHCSERREHSTEVAPAAGGGPQRCTLLGSQTTALLRYRTGPYHQRALTAVMDMVLTEDDAGGCARPPGTSRSISADLRARRARVQPHATSNDARGHTRGRRRADGDAATHTSDGVRPGQPPAKGSDCVCVVCHSYHCIYCIHIFCVKLGGSMSCWAKSVSSTRSNRSNSDARLLPSSLPPPRASSSAGAMPRTASSAARTRSSDAARQAIAASCPRASSCASALPPRSSSTSGGTQSSHAATVSSPCLLAKRVSAQIAFSFSAAGSPSAQQTASANGSMPEAALIAAAAWPGVKARSRRKVADFCLSSSLFAVRASSSS